MNTAVEFMQSYLLNSLWQVPLVWAAAWLVARLLPAGAIKAQHRVWVAALLAGSLLPACSSPGALRAGLFSLLHRGGGDVASVSVALGSGTILRGRGVLPALLLCMTCLYGVVVLAFAVRLLLRWLGVVRLRRNARTVTLEAQDAAVLASCCKRLGLERVATATAQGIFGPVTIGALRPLLLLPPRMLTEISSADLHAALAHEAAHIRRHDYLKNLLYEVLRLPVAFHPCAWLTRNAVVESREVLCDGIAADLLAGREAYARSLLRLAAALLQAPQARATHAIGIFDAHAFERRIMRLTTRPIVLTASRRVFTAFACGSIALLAAGSALALHVHVAVPVAAMATAASADHPLKVSSGVMAAQVLNKVQPVYPPEAKSARVQGAVVLHAIISKDGIVEELQVVSGPEELRGSSLDAVRQWTYKPFLLNGEPTDVETTITVTYSLGQ